MNQVLDVEWKGRIIARRIRHAKSDGILNFELDTRQQKKLNFVP